MGEIKIMWISVQKKDVHRHLCMWTILPVGKVGAIPSNLGELRAWFCGG